MAILTTAEDGTVNTAAVDFDVDILHVGTRVEAHALVALAGTEEVAGDGMGGDLCKGAGHAEGGGAAEVDGAGVENVAQFASAIDVGEDMTAGNLHTGGTQDTSGRLYIERGVGIVGNIPGFVGHPTRTAAEDVAIEGVAVVGRGILIGVIGIVWGAERPVVTLIEELGIVGGDIVGPLFRSVDTIQIGGGSVIPSATYLATLYLDIGAVEYAATLAAAIDGTLDEGCAADGDVGGVDIGKMRYLGVTGGGGGVAHGTLTTTENMTLESGHNERGRAYLTTADGDGGTAGIGIAGGGIAIDCAGVLTHGSHFTTTVDIALHPELVITKIIGRSQ